MVATGLLFELRYEETVPKVTKVMLKGNSDDIYSLCTYLEAPV